MDLGIGPVRLFFERSNIRSLDNEDTFPISRGPLSWLLPKRRLTREGMLKKVEGIVPKKEFDSASKKLKLESEVMLGGSVPVN